MTAQWNEHAGRLAFGGAGWARGAMTRALRELRARARRAWSCDVDAVIRSWCATTACSKGAQIAICDLLERAPNSSTPPSLAPDELCVLARDGGLALSTARTTPKGMTEFVTRAPAQGPIATTRSRSPAWAAPTPTRSPPSIIALKARSGIDVRGLPIEKARHPYGV